MSDLHHALQERIAAHLPQTTPPFDALKQRKRQRDRRRYAVAAAALSGVAVAGIVAAPAWTAGAPDRVPSFAGPAGPAATDVRQPPAPTDPAVSVLAGRIGPGAPPDGKVPPTLQLTFTDADGNTIRSTARDGEYKVTLPPGTWDVRSQDRRACALGITVTAGASFRHDLLYPGDCMRVETPPDQPAPVAPEPADG